MVPKETIKVLGGGVRGSFSHTLALDMARSPVYHTCKNQKSFCKFVEGTEKKKTLGVKVNLAAVTGQQMGVRRQER